MKKFKAIVKPNEATGSYVSTPYGPVLLSDLFPAHKLRKDQMQIRTGLGKKQRWAFDGC